MADPIGNDIDIQVSTDDGDVLLSGVIIDVRELASGGAEMDICLDDGDIIPVFLSARQYAGLIGDEEALHAPPN